MSYNFAPIGTCFNDKLLVPFNRIASVIGMHNALWYTPSMGTGTACFYPSEKAWKPWLQSENEKDGYVYPSSWKSFYLYYSLADAEISDKYHPRPLFLQREISRIRGDLIYRTADQRRLTWGKAFERSTDECPNVWFTTTGKSVWTMIPIVDRSEDGMEILAGGLIVPIPHVRL